MAPRDRPGEPGSAGLTAEELIAAVRVHVDRVHDAVRRTSGREGTEAVGVVRASALALVDEAATRPLDAEKAVGTWFRLALERAGRGPSDHDGSRDAGDVLAGLPDDARTAVLLRDAYDLPTAAVAAALSTDEDDALTRVALARLAVPAAGAPSDLRELADGERPPDPGDTALRISAAGTGGHADLATLARLAEDRPVAPSDATARRHVLSCTACRANVQGQSRASRVLAGVLVVGPSDRARAAVLAEVEERARQRLPRSATASRRRTAGDERTGPFALPAPEVVDVSGPVGPELEEEPRRLLSPLLVVLSVVLAALAGVGAGLLMSEREEPARLAGADGRLPPGVRLISPQPTPAATLVSPPTVAEQRPRTTVVVVPPSPLPSPSPTPSPTPTPTPSPSAAPPALGVQPAAGPAGTELTVTGTDFPPGAQVRVDYLDTTGAATGTGADAVADAEGTLTATVVAEDPPGPHDVVATAGDVTARATFTVEAP